MTNLNDPSSWENKDVVVSYLANQLTKGRLSLVLGAGISQPCGLPDWKTLVQELQKINGQPPSESTDLTDAVSTLKQRFYQNKSEQYIQDVKKALYSKGPLNIERIRKSDTLSAIGSLVMASQRGSASKVINFNFDDILETYLEYHGFVTTSIHSELHWASTHDVTIYHPHGFIPHTPSRIASEEIVLSANEYLEFSHDSSWPTILQEHFRTHTCLYLGLSGKDSNLRKAIHNAHKKHAIKKERIPFNGVRIATKDNDDPGTHSIISELGVWTHYI